MEMICGYRVVRELGGGERSQVLLARDPADRTVVLRVLPAESDEEAVSRLLGAMTAVEHPHLLPLADVATCDDGRVVLVLPRVAGGTLGEALGRRSAPNSGQRIGILRAVLGALRALHEAGWAHGRVDASSVLLATDGTTVLAGFGDARPLDEPGRARDLESVAALTCSMLASEAGAAALLRRLDDELPSLDALEWSLSDVERAAAARADGDALPDLSLDGTDAYPSAGPRAPQWGASPWARLGAVAGEPVPHTPVPVSWRERIAELEGLTPLLRAATAALRSVRTRVWIAAAGVTAALIAAVVMIPLSEDPASAESDRPTPGIESAATPGEAEHAEVGEEGPTEAADTSTSAPTAAGAATRGDDPLSAVTALLVARQVCFETRDAACFEEVDQAGSAALADDVARAASLPQGAPAPAPLDIGDAPFVQRTGDSAIIDAQSVSVLLVRGESGWRIRDVFDR